MKKSKIIAISCDNCTITFQKRIRIDGNNSKRNYCSTVCRKADKQSYCSEWTPERRLEYSIKNTGINNPNAGNTWTDSQRNAASKLKIQQFIDNPEYAYECGKSNRGVKFSKERIHAMHGHRVSAQYSHPHSAESKQKIGLKSKEKWTTAYRETYRATMESLGHWIPLTEKTPYSIYYKDSNWIENMISYFNGTDLQNLKDFGIFNKNNSKGWVRDHIFPRKIGYEFNIPPYILRHPANLQFISHSANIAKGFVDRRLTQIEKDVILNLLIKKILQFDKTWKEQEMCIKFIKENYGNF